VIRERTTKASVSRIKVRAFGSGAPSVNVPMNFVIRRYRMPIPPMTTRFTITVKRVPCFVFFTP
jgi:hypothetical protein